MPSEPDFALLYLPRMIFLVRRPNQSNSDTALNTISIWYPSRKFF